MLAGRCSYNMSSLLKMSDHLTGLLDGRAPRWLVLSAAGLGAVTTGVLVYRAWAHAGRSRPPLPPGPRGWPVVGCVGLLTPDLYLKLTAMGKDYGDVFSFYIGNRLTVVLNSARAIRAAFVDQRITFAGRPHPWTMKMVNVKEVINNGTYSEEWRAEKKFVLNALRQFGYGSSSLEDKITVEIDTILDEYRAAAQRKLQLNPRKHMPKTMANLIFSILINERYDYDDKQLADKLRLIAKWQERVGEANMLDFFPWLRFFPWKPIRKLKQIRDEIVPMYRKHVLDHKDTFDSTHCRDVIDVYLKERGIHYDEDRLIGLFFSFVGDAVDSLPEVMVWIVLYICSDLELQRKLQQEVDEVTGSSRQVVLTDRPRMPLIEATVMEALRLSTFVPISEPHCPLEETTLFGYHIPKGCNVMANLYAAHVDEAVWENPSSFNPHRFLDGEGNLTSPDAFMPFSVGRRMCLADQLANKVMFLFLARLVMSFTVTFSDPDNPPDLQPQQWYVRKAQDFSVTVQHRT